MICIRMLVLLVVSLPQVKLASCYLLSDARQPQQTLVMHDPVSMPNLTWKIAVAAACDRRRAGTPTRTSASVGGAAVPISRDDLSDEIEAYDNDMLRPW
jgi:hypothetical protein